MKINIDLSRTAITAILISLALVYPLLWLKMLADPTQHTGADFIAFYAAGRIADQEGPSHAYDLILQKKYQEGVVQREIELQETFPYIHPPFVIPLAQIVSNADYLKSFQRWAMLMLLLFTAGIPFLIAPARKFFSQPQTLIFAAGIFLFFPIFQSLLLGQDNAIIFLGLSLLMWGTYAKKDWAAGLGLSLATVRPHFAFFLLLPFLFQRRAIFGWFLLFVFALTLFSFGVVGTDGLKGFLHILTVSGSGEGYRTSEENMVNLIGLLRRLFPFLSAALIRSAGWAFYGLAFFSTGVYFWRNHTSPSGEEISLAVVAALFFSPHTHAQDLVLLIAPIMAVILILLERQRIQPAQAVLIPLAISLLLLFSYYSPILTHSIPYLLMAGLFFAVKQYKALPAKP
ncbi:MAG TPA: glycosyltransferase family 87 protein [Anaerolineales bacterium]|nr:glycosyltransferase family 87 protein [Anaerolineales bacterium]